MKKKSVIFLACSALLVLSILAGSWYSASAAFITDKGIFYGRQGIFVPGGLSTDFIKLSRISPSRYRGAPVAFNRPLMNLEFINSSGSHVSIPFAMTYVIYTISKAEMKQWDKGELSLYYKDVTTQAWKKCFTFAVSGTMNGEGTTNLTCVAPQATVFGLGRTR